MNKGLFPYELKEELVLRNMLFMDNTMDATVFVHGVCGIFALALNERFGYPIYQILDLRDDDDDSEPYSQLVHIFCMDDENYIDVRGMTDNDELFFDDFADDLGSDTDIFPLLASSCKKFIQESMSEDEFEILNAAAKSIIEKHIDWYTTRKEN